MTDCRLAVPLSIAVVLAGCVAPAVPPSSGRPSPSGTASVAPIAVASQPIPWTPAEIPGEARPASLGEVARASFGDLLATDDGFLIVGGTGPDRDDPLALHSADGVTWTEEAISGRPGLFPSMLAPWGDRIIGLGAAVTDECAEHAVEVWIRDVDQTWTTLPFDPVLCGLGPSSVVTFGGRPWIVGTSHDDRPVLLEGGDDLTWIDHHDQLGDVWVGGAAVDASGMWIFARVPQGPPVTIHSRDGVTWQTEPLSAADGGPISIDLVTTFGGQVVAFGSTSGDGVRLRRTAGGWEEVPMPGLSPEFDALFVGEGLLIGIDGGFTIGQEGLWISADGVAWRQIKMARGAAAGLAGIAVHDDRAVLLEPSRIWTAPASFLAL